MKFPKSLSCFQFFNYQVLINTIVWYHLNMYTLLYHVHRHKVVVAKEHTIMTPLLILKEEEQNIHVVRLSQILFGSFL